MRATLDAAGPELMAVVSASTSSVAMISRLQEQALATSAQVSILLTQSAAVSQQLSTLASQSAAVAHQILLLMEQSTAAAEQSQASQVTLSTVDARLSAMEALLSSTGGSCTRAVRLKYHP
jgi:erythromycin esterase-like protein